MHVLPITGPVGAEGEDGAVGASARFSIHTDGDRRVLQLEGYVDADDVFTAESTDTYVAADGFTTTLADAVDIRGGTGGTGGAGTDGTDGDDGGTPRLSVHTDGERRVLQLEGYQNADGTFTAVSPAMFLSSSGFTTTLANAVNFRGIAGTDGTNATDGDDGSDGGTPRLSIVEDGNRLVVQVLGFEFGIGTGLTTFTALGQNTYIGDSGLTTTIADAVNIRGDAVFYIPAADVGGTANSIELSSDEISSYTAGLSVAFKVETENTGAVMVEIEDYGAVALRKADNSEFAAGELTDNRMVIMVYDGTRFLSNVDTTETVGGKSYYVAPADFAQTGNAATMTIDGFPGYEEGQVFAFTAEVTNTGNVNIRVNSESFYTVRRPDGNHFGAGEFMDGSLYFVMFTGLTFMSLGAAVDDTTLEFNSDGEIQIKAEGVGHDQLADGTEGEVVSYNSSSRPVSRPLRAGTFLLR